MATNLPPAIAADLTAALTALAARQHGNVTRGQLLELGLGPDAIAHRVRTARLHRVHPGVYAVGRPARSALERAAAAVLACGPDAALSHLSALALWGLWKRWPVRFEVSLRRGDRRPRGISVHRPRHLAPKDLRTHQGIRVTSPARTLLDCAPLLDPRQLTRAVNEAQISGRLRRSQLVELIQRNPAHRGARLLAPLLEDGSGLTRSQFEDAFKRFCGRHGLPAPVMNARVAGYEVDALFPEHSVIVELDGWAFHRSRASFEGDRTRDADTLAAGFVTNRITWERITRHPEREAERLRTILAARAPRHRP